MRYFILLLLLLSLTILPAESGWKKIHQCNLEFWDLNCADSLNCISLASPGSIGTSIIRTTNGGNNWFVQYADTARKVYDSAGNWTDTFFPKFKGALCLAYVTPNFAVVGHREGQITISRDGGNTWDSVKSGTSHDINKICFRDSLHGAALTYWNLLITSDGGASWREISRLLDSTSSPFFTCLSYLADSCIHVTGYMGKEKGNTHFISIDDGKSWSQNNNISMEKFQGLHGMSFINEQKGWIVGWNTISSIGPIVKDVILATEDGGKSWKVQLDTLAYPKFGLTGIYFANENDGIAWGDGQKKWRTSDGGKSWLRDESLPTASVDDFTTMAFPRGDTKKIFACTYIYGQIWLYDEALSKVEDAVNKTGEPLYPNPANSFINVRLDAASLFGGSICVYNTFGEQVLSKSLPAEKTSVRLDVSSLPPGVYFLRTGSRTEKFVKE